MKSKPIEKLGILIIFGAVLFSNIKPAWSMYDPQLMRFTARDPEKGKYKEPLSLHKYLYCENDSINRTDPTGKYGAVVGGLKIDGDRAEYSVGFLAQTKELVLIASAISFATYVAVDAISNGDDSLFNNALSFVNLVFQQALNKYGEMKGGKQNVRDRDLWRYKDKFKVNDEFNKFREFVEEVMGKEGRDATKKEVEELFDEFMK